MTVSKAHLAARAVALKRQRLSLALIGRRLDCSAVHVYKLIRRHAPELIGTRRPPLYTVRDL